MATHTTLYLTPAESARFAAFSDALREGWTVEPETGTAYESLDVLKVRAGMARFDSYPALHDLVKNAADTGTLDPSFLARMPESVLPELCFTIGARGITALIAALFAMAADDADIEGIAGLSHIRRDILATNASITLA